MKEYARKFYQSKEWKRCREGYIAFRYGLCERCENSGKIVHHKKYITPENINDVDITLSWSNLELVCQDCHNKEHNEKYSVVEEGLKFNANGDLVRVRSEYDE